MVCHNIEHAYTIADDLLRLSHNNDCFKKSKK